MSPWHPGGAPHSVSLSRNRWISHHQQAQLHSQIQLARIQQAVRREQAAAKAQGMIEQISTALKGDGSQSKEIAEAVNNLSQALISEGTASRAHEMKMHDSEMKMFMDLLTKSNQK